MVGSEMMKALTMQYIDIARAYGKMHNMLVTSMIDYSEAENENKVSVTFDFEASHATTLLSLVVVTYDFCKQNSFRLAERIHTQNTFTQHVLLFGETKFAFVFYKQRKDRGYKVSVHPVAESSEVKENDHIEIGAR